MKSLKEHLLVHAGDAPTHEDLENLRQNQRRMLQVIQARWIALAIFLLYGGYLSVYALREAREGLTPGQVWVPVIAIAAVAAYNLLFRLTYLRWSRFREANLGQLLVDGLVVTVLVHYSGGVHSWFWAMYLLIILEAAFLLERAFEVWIVVGTIWLAYGSTLALEAAGVLEPQSMPFVGRPLHGDVDFVLLTFGWMLCMSGTVGGVAIVLASMIRAQEAALRSLVVRDELTGLYNRRHFFQRLRGEIARCRRYKRRFSLILIDVDDFKAINDRYGHLVGDEVLRTIGRILGTQIRRSATTPSYDVDIACRYGGEEFAIILPETPAEGGRVAAERIRKNVAEQGPIVVAERLRQQIKKSDPGGRHVTVSMGICTFPLHGEDTDALIATADAALYQAKAEGKDRVVIAPIPNGSRAQDEDIEAPERTDPPRPDQPSTTGSEPSGR